MIYTARYPNKQITNRKHVPIAISRGLPRWGIRHYQIEYRLWQLAPSKLLLQADFTKGKFKAEYIQQLNENVDILYLQAQFKAMAGNRDPVLLCFENLDIKGNWCHRRFFAQWWQEKTKEEVNELAETVA
jgi:hypothetical protein